MKRIQRPEGQLFLTFDLTVEDLRPNVVEPAVAAPVVETVPEPEVLLPPAEPCPATRPAKQRTKQVWEHEGPSVTLHKKGRFLLIKPNDPVAAMYWADIKQRLYVEEMRFPRFYGAPNCADPDMSNFTPEDITGKVRLWKLLGKDPLMHPYCRILGTYGVRIFLSKTLTDWMVKERRLADREATPFPTAPVSLEGISLFERCCDGTILQCSKNFHRPGTRDVIFEEGKRYMIVGTGSESADVVRLCTTVAGSVKKIDVTSDNTYDWTSFDPPMESWFTDQDSSVEDEPINEVYPHLIQAANKKLDATGLRDKLYAHVQQDVVQALLKRGMLNAYPMRMAKTSFAIAWAKMCGNQRAAFIGPRNARIFTVNELRRMGFEEDKDFVVVDELADLEKPAWMYLLTYSWVKKGSTDSGARRKWENYLRPSWHDVRRRTGEGRDDFETITQRLRNECPHCGQEMHRLQRLGTPDIPPDNSVLVTESTNRLGMPQRAWYAWTTERGYICRNRECTWYTDNRVKDGAAWDTRAKDGPVVHRGGYVDWGLAAHAGCADRQPKGYVCATCGESDGVRRPPLVRRFRKRFKLLVVDEIHACKGKTTDISQAVLSMRARRRLGLTGTPISNNPKDLYWTISWLVGAPNKQMPFVQGEGLKGFEDRFCSKMVIEKAIGEERDEETGEVRKLTKRVSKDVPFLKNPPDFWRFAAPKIIRRNYTDPLFRRTLEENGRMMPEVMIEKQECPMDPEQAKIMLASIKDFRTEYEKMLKDAEKQGATLNSALVINQMSTLKMVATVPDMLNDKFKTEIYKGNRGGGKMDPIKRIVDRVVNQEKGKILIISNFIKMQNICRDELMEYRPILFNTNWDDDARREAFEAFQYGDAKVFIAGTMAIREGVDLSAANTCICVDLLWAPALQAQAWSRVMAPGKDKRICNVYLMVSSNSLDEHIYTVFYSKMQAATQALDRKAINRRAHQFDVKQFVDRVLEEETAIQSFLVEAGANMLVVPEIEDMEVREA